VNQAATGRLERGGGEPLVTQSDEASERLKKHALENRDDIEPIMSGMKAGLHCVKDHIHEMVSSSVKGRLPMALHAAGASRPVRAGDSLATAPRIAEAMGAGDEVVMQRLLNGRRMGKRGNRGAMIHNPINHYGLGGHRSPMFGFFGRRNRDAVEMDVTLKEGLGAARFRHRMGMFIAANGVALAPKVGLDHQVAGVCASMVYQAVLASGRCWGALKPLEVDAAALLLVIASDHMTRQALIEFESTAMLGGMGLLYDDVQGEGQALMRKAGVRFNVLSVHPNERATVLFAGKVVAQWFATNAGQQWMPQLAEVAALASLPLSASPP
jgi:hypothetical protein